MPLRNYRHGLLSMVKVPSPFKGVEGGRQAG